MLADPQMTIRSSAIMTCSVVRLLIDDNENGNGNGKAGVVVCLEESYLGMHV